MDDWENYLIDDDDDDVDDDDEEEDHFHINMKIPRTVCKRRVAFTPPEQILLRRNVILSDLIMEYVLPFLPAKTLYRFRTVCKKWNDWITNPFFAYKQSNSFRDISGFFHQFSNGHRSFISLNSNCYGIRSSNLSFLNDSVQIMDSCGGLVCCKNDMNDNIYYICNPVTREFRKLPEPALYHGLKPHLMLVYEPCELDFDANFEIVCPVLVADVPLLHFEIYSSRTNMWRISDTVCCDLDALELKSGGFYMKGVVYWQTLSGKVLAFHVKSELYEMMNLHPNCNIVDGVLSQVKGEVVYVWASKDEDDDEEQIVISIYGIGDMMMKHRIGVELGMIFGEVRALPCLNGDLVYIRAGDKVIEYNVVENKANTLVSSMMEIDSQSSLYVPYVNTLVSVPH